MTYQIDVWSGDLHQRHFNTLRTEVWAVASTFMEEQVEAGNLCNILHTDFIAPDDRVEEQMVAMRKYLKPD